MTLATTKVDVKLFTQRCDGVLLDELVPVFHGFIQKRLVTDELLIDVADYSHVVDGPGVLLIGHEGQYGFELQGGRAALLYSLRRARVEGFEQALRYAITHALRAAALLHAEDGLRGKLRFGGQEILVRVNDRLAAPNTADTWKQAEPTLRAVLGRLFDGETSIEPEKPSGQLFTVRARAASPASIDTLLSRLA